LLVSTPDSAPTNRLDLVRSFVNTLDIDRGDETLTSPRALEEWLDDQGLSGRSPLGDEDLERTLAFREALRALLLANSREPLDASTVESLREAAGRAPLRIDIDEDGRAALAPARGGIDELVARLLSAVAEAQADGTWERLKACPADHCGWAFYDHSRNRSRIWCSMEVCGNRSKTRAYRARRS
jgi:predicted RNA-binding Zn ribbon-like protein